MQLTAETYFDVLGVDRKSYVRIYVPVFGPDYEVWSCKFEIGYPMQISSCVHCLDSLKALVLTLKIVSTHLYSARLYKEGRLGVGGEFGGNPFIPGPKELLDIAPCPF